MSEKLTTTRKERKRKIVHTFLGNKMTREEPCPHSKRRADSTHLRTCKTTGQICHDSIFLFGWKECAVFLDKSKRKRKGG